MKNQQYLHDVCGKGNVKKNNQRKTHSITREIASKLL